jgi:hypothetical protein
MQIQEQNPKNNGGYDSEGIIWHQHSNKLMIEILRLFPKDIPVVDLGCGHNFYVSILRHYGYDAWGIDLVDLGSKWFSPGDLTLPRPVSTDVVKYDQVNMISLEVGEHIPESGSEQYLDNLVSFGKGNILMSWALPGQHGHGHINCQTNEWVISRMYARGYELDHQVTEDLRKAVEHCHCNWFRNTLMYFKPKAS